MIGALVIFLIGWMLAQGGGGACSACGSFRGCASRRERPTPSSRSPFYFLLTVAFLTALRMVQIPLTAFAFVGGALAIGVGFGSQNIVNNFISGIILLVERPIKRSDLVDVGGIFGNVEQIGLRSTRIRTGDNVHIIVPNASFLESNVVNWTHSDPKVRVSVSVGVAYGSPDARRRAADPPGGGGARLGAARSRSGPALHRLRRQRAGLRDAFSGS